MPIPSAPSHRARANGPWLWGALTVLLLGGRAHGQDPNPLAEGEEGVPKRSCVNVSTETPYVAGFDHIVVLHSECKKTMHCDVSSDVNPEVQQVALEPGASARLVTFRGSPARVFTPVVTCK